MEQCSKPQIGQSISKLSCVAVYVFRKEGTSWVSLSETQWTDFFWFHSISIIWSEIDHNPHFLVHSSPIFLPQLLPAFIFIPLFIVVNLGFHSRMARSKVLGFLLLVFFSMVLLSVAIIPGCRADQAMLRHSVFAQREQWFQGKFEGEDRNSRRLMIGSTRPTCTYNECRGCRFRCRAEQVPVEGNDPIHSAYHYRCVCHRR